MSDKKRPRACDTCHSIKIKCSLGSDGGDSPCARCLRLGKECTVSPPKRQKDRVAELEAQVEALTKLLQSQNIQRDGNETPPASGKSTPEEDSRTRSVSGPGITPAPLVAQQQKKRRLDDEYSPQSNDIETGIDRAESIELDCVLARHIQEELLARYQRDLVPYFPAVPIAGDQTYEGLRKTKPLLLQSAIYCASFGALPLDKQEDVGKIVMDLFAAKAMAEGEKSAELIQAMQAAVLYYRTTKHHTHIAAWQFIEMAGGLAKDIGIGGPERPPSLAVPAGGPYIDSSEAWRTWLVCHMLSATLALFMRKPNASSWDARDSHNLEMLEYSYFRLDTDELLGQHVRAERLCDVIATQQCLYDSGTPTVDVADPLVQSGMQRMMDSITDWKAQVPATIKGPSMDFWENVALLYLHEPVLHTATNKASFCAPYIAPRISVTDFPKPLVSQEHITSLYRIRDSAHAVIDIMEGLDFAHAVAMPAMYFPGRVAYAIYVLAKLYVAVTARNNSFGAFIDPESLLLDLYLEKMSRSYAKTAQIDEFCGQARILSASFKLREWYQSYKQTLPQPFDESRTGDGPHMSAYPTVPTSSVAMQNQWNNMVFAEGTHNLNLEELFADPSLSDWFPQPLDDNLPATNALDTRYL